MHLNNPQDYVIRLRTGGRYELFSDGRSVKFTKPASAHGVAKLYTLSNAGKLIYVGIARQPMANRLNYGFKANGMHGYHGYKWRHLTCDLRLTVWTASVNGQYVGLREMETIEAEVAFVCRDRSGQWPEFQHEIHFFPSTDVHREAAERVYELAATGNG